MEILNGADTRRELKKAVKASNENGNKVRFAVAFWGKGIIEDLSIDPANTEIVCNLSMGGTNPDVIGELLDGGAEIRHSDQLHSKLYLTDSIGVIGSSNASANGLSMEGKECSGWLETNIVFSAEENGEIYEEAVEHYECIRKGAKLLSGPKDPALVKAREAWKKKRHSNPFVGVEKGKSLLWHIKKKPEVLENREIYIVTTREDSPEEFWKKLEEEQKLFEGNAVSTENSKLSAYDNFDELPKDAFLITFHIGPRLGGFMFTSFYERMSGLPDVEFKIDGDDSTMQMCMQIEQIAGIGNVGKLSEWKPLIKELVGSKGGADICSIRDFVDKVGHLF